MKTIPKYVDELLRKRRHLAIELLKTASKVDEYCAKIGIYMLDTHNSVNYDYSIFYEPWNAYDNTKNAIKKQLNSQKKG